MPTEIMEQAKRAPEAVKKRAQEKAQSSTATAKRTSPAGRRNNDNGNKPD